MYKFDIEKWPIVIFEFNEKQSEEEHKETIKLWDELFARKGNFIVIRRFKDYASLRNSARVVEMTQAWLENRAAALIKERVVAMLNIVPEKAYLKMKQENIDNLYEIPGGVFDSPKAAYDWIKNNINPAFVSL